MPAKIRPGTREREKVRKAGGVGNIDQAKLRVKIRDKVTAFEVANDISLDCRKIYESLVKTLNKFSYYAGCSDDISGDETGVSFSFHEEKHKTITVDLEDGDRFIFDDKIGYQSFTLKRINKSSIQLDPVKFDLIKGTDEKMQPADYILFFEGAKEALEKIAQYIALIKTKSTSSSNGTYQWSVGETTPSIDHNNITVYS